MAVGLHSLRLHNADGMPNPLSNPLYNFHARVWSGGHNLGRMDTQWPVHQCRDDTPCVWEVRKRMDKGLGSLNRGENLCTGRKKGISLERNKKNRAKLRKFTCPYSVKQRVLMAVPSFCIAVESMLCSSSWRKPSDDAAPIWALAVMRSA